MDWSQYVAMAFAIFAPAYFLYRIPKQDKEYGLLDDVKKH